ncbi:hypothetical protein HDU96_003933 [Phlyctochytrium bullatum]|nr:hypothetical protein HDU96_003933 [Phlyctochytrium bullatum]
MSSLHLHSHPAPFTPSTILQMPSQSRPGTQFISPAKSDYAGPTRSLASAAEAERLGRENYTGELDDEADDMESVVSSHGSVEIMIPNEASSLPLFLTDSESRQQSSRRVDNVEHARSDDKAERRWSFSGEPRKGPSTRSQSETPASRLNSRNDSTLRSLANPSATAQDFLNSIGGLNANGTGPGFFSSLDDSALASRSSRPGIWDSCPRSLSFTTEGPQHQGCLSSSASVFGRGKLVGSPATLAPSPPLVGNVGLVFPPLAPPSLSLPANAPFIVPFGAACPIQFGGVSASGASTPTSSSGVRSRSESFREGSIRSTRKNAGGSKLRISPTRTVSELTGIASFTSNGRRRSHHHHHHHHHPFARRSLSPRRDFAPLTGPTNSSTAAMTSSPTAVGVSSTHPAFSSPSSWVIPPGTRSRPPPSSSVFAALTDYDLPPYPRTKGAAGTIDGGRQLTTRASAPLLRGIPLGSGVGFGRRGTDQGQDLTHQPHQQNQFQSYQTHHHHHRQHHEVEAARPYNHHHHHLPASSPLAGILLTTANPHQTSGAVSPFGPPPVPFPTPRRVSLDAISAASNASTDPPFLASGSAPSPTTSLSSTAETPPSAGRGLLFGDVEVDVGTQGFGFGGAELALAFAGMRLKDGQAGEDLRL